MPDIKTVAEFSKAASAVIAAFAFLWSLYLWRKGEKAKQILSWQQVVVFKIIKERKKCTFKEIKSDYLNSQQQLKDVDIPKEEIQDNALMLVIIGLLEKKLVIIGKNEATQEDTYSISYYSVNEIDNQYKQLMVEELKKRNALQEIGSKIIDIIRASGGKYTLEGLFTFLTAEGKLNINYTDYNNLIMGMIARKFLIVNDDDKLQLGDLKRIDTYTKTTVTMERRPAEREPVSQIPSDKR